MFCSNREFGNDNGFIFLCKPKHTLLKFTFLLKVLVFLYKQPLGSNSQSIHIKHPAPQDLERFNCRRGYEP
jgi:hypothetical protein